MFSRLHDRGTSQSAGMGLAICKKIITSLNGTIALHSIVNEGSTFVIELPKG